MIKHILRYSVSDKGREASYIRSASALIKTWRGMVSVNNSRVLQEYDEEQFDSIFKRVKDCVGSLEKIICEVGEVERLDDYKIAVIVSLSFDKIQAKRPSLSLMEYVQKTYEEDQVLQKKADDETLGLQLKVVY